jgi:hypothetical protein
MAPRLRLIATVAVLAALSSSPAAFAAGLDAKSEADAKEATRLYKEGNYEDAAKLFARLTVDYPDMPIFERSLGGTSGTGGATGMAVCVFGTSLFGNRKFGP